MKKTLISVLGIALAVVLVAQAASMKMIDDFEDGDNMNLCLTNKIAAAAGAWFAVGDEHGATKIAFAIEALKKPTSTSQRALHVKGTLGVSADPKWCWAQATSGLNTEGKTADLTGSKGITFLARSATSTNASVSPAAVINGVNLSGTGVGHARKFATTPQWQRFTFAWTEFAQPEWATGDAKVALSLATVESIVWAVHDEGKPFDLWLDDVALVY